MKTVRGVKDRRFHFVQLLNAMFEDKKLPLRAKGFIGYCLTKPSSWQFHIKHLCESLDIGRDALYSTINECIEHGYAVRYQIRAENGSFGESETIVSDSKEEIEVLKKEMESPDFKLILPNPENPDADEAESSNPSHSNTEATSNTQKQQQQQVVVVSENSFCKSDAHRIGLTRNWLPDEIEVAWLVFEKSTCPISDPIEYIEAVINNKRIKNQNKKQATPCQTEAKDNSEKWKKRREEISENATSEPLLVRLLRQNGSKEKFSTS